MIDEQHDIDLEALPQWGPSQIPHTLFDIVLLGVDAVFWHVRQFTLEQVAKCHSTISWLMSSYFPITGFKATVRASKGDNWHNCTLPHGGRQLDCGSNYCRRPNINIDLTAIRLQAGFRTKIEPGFMGLKTARLPGFQETPVTRVSFPIQLQAWEMG